MGIKIACNNHSTLGANALYNNNGGSSTALGYSAGISNTTGSNNTLIGANADVILNNLTNATAIGFNARAGASNTLILGGTGSNMVNVGINTSLPAEKLHVNGAIKIDAGGYTGLVQNATLPAPAGGAGTIVFANNHFFGWNGSQWKQLDN